MPYHVFEINAFKQFEHLASHDNYRSAKNAVKELRKSAGASSGNEYRMMFAASPELALKLLNEKREPRPMGEHD
ncbi:MAG: hypothetical protein KTR35_19855 [Gammaproteobacteria bacterium]|nr:hypothetical protein [Gammaproteobacteria bacterium]